MSNEEFNKLLKSLKQQVTTNTHKKPSIKVPQALSPQLLHSTHKPIQPKHIQIDNQHINRSLGAPQLPNYTYAMPTIQQKLQLIQAQRVTQCLNHIFDQTGHKQSLDDLLNGPMKRIWDLSVAREIGRLAQGIFKVKGNNAIDFIPKSEVPKNKIVTYANMVCDFRPRKEDQYRVRLTVGGDRLEYYLDTTAPAASLLEAKLLINSTISQSHQGAKFFTLDIKDFFCKQI